jgi:hypothetical protein
LKAKRRREMPLLREAEEGKKGTESFEATPEERMDAEEPCLERIGKGRDRDDLSLVKVAKK